MSQTSYSLNMNEAFAGMKVDSRFDSVESKFAQGAIGFGLGVMSAEDAVNQVRTPAYNKIVLTASTTLVTSNSTIVTVNGVAHDAVVFADTHANNLIAIAAEIETDDAILSADVTDTNVITIYGADGLAITVTAVTTAGTGQPTWTPVLSDPGVFRGISLHRHVEPVAGVCRYVDEDAVDVLRKGMVWMPYVPGSSPTVDTALYINLASASYVGYATIVSSGNKATGGYIREINTALGLVKAEINLP